MRIIAGKFHHRTIAAPKGDATRPTSSRLREAFFNIVQAEIEGADFLDIFAGSGAMGLEALSRGANHATFIEANRMALAALDANLKQLKITHEAKVLFGDYQKMLKRLKLSKKQFDIIFADAPYDMIEAIDRILQEIGDGDLLKPGGRFFMESNQLLNPSLDLHGLSLVNSRKSGKTFLHQFERAL